MKRLLTFALLSLFALTSTAFAGANDKHKTNNKSNQSQQQLVRDHRTTNVAPVVRDHRISNSIGQGKPQFGYNGLSKNDLSKTSGGVHVSSNGSIGRLPAAVGSKPLVSLTHPISPRVPPRDPRKLSSQDLVSQGAVDQRFTTVLGNGPVVRDHRKPVLGPVVRDHRISSSATASYQWPSFNQSGNATVRDHRGIGLASAAGGVMVSNSLRPRQPVDNTIYGVGPGPRDVVNAIGHGVNTIGRGVGTVGKTVVRTVDTVGTTVGRTVNAVGTTVGRTVNAVGKTAVRTVDTVGRTAVRTVGTVSRTVGRTVNTVGKTVGNAAGAVGNAVGNAAGAVGDFFGF